MTLTPEQLASLDANAQHVRVLRDKIAVARQDARRALMGPRP